MDDARQHGPFARPRQWDPLAPAIGEFDHDHFHPALPERTTPHSDGHPEAAVQGIRHPRRPRLDRFGCSLNPL
jgi:hypothetical protein